nr:unnamed protein product [Digitaria exilis]
MGSMALNGGSTNQALLDAQLELWHSTFAHIKSMALKSALDLHIADAIHHHGDNGATIPQIVSRVTIHSSKIPCLRRLMRLFVATGVFAVHHPPPSGSRDADADEPMYMLTPTSRLLVGSQNNLTALTALVTHPAMVTPFFELGKWLLHELPDPCIFKRAHGRALWEHASRDAAFDALVNDGMLSDSHFIMDIAISECAHVFGGIGSLVDVGGGLGAAAKAISKAFPGVECSVLDFDHVVAKAPSGTKVRYVVGDMFESVPPADAMFFKVYCSMAAFNKLGSLLRHSALTSGASASSSPALFNAARLMSTKLFVGGLSWGTDDQSLKEAFSAYGEVTEARVITDRDTGRSRGFGFVNFSNSDEAKEAVAKMDGQMQFRGYRALPKGSFEESKP